MIMIMIMVMFISLQVNTRVRMLYACIYAAETTSPDWYTLILERTTSDPSSDGVISNVCK